MFDNFFYKCSLNNQKNVINDKHNKFILFKLIRFLSSIILNWSIILIKKYIIKKKNFFSVRKLRTSHLIKGSNPPDYGVQCQKEIQVYMQRVCF